MANEMKKGEDFDSSNLVIFIYKWRKPLFIVMVIAIVGSWFFSSPWFITPKFKSTVIMFPASSSSISKSLLNEQSLKGQDITAFGEDDQAEQLLQILNSNSIRDRIMRKFDLMRHYDIDSTSDVRYSNLFKEYDDNITFRRTEFMAVQISVYDKDPQMAADIANTIASLLDSAKNDIMRQRSVKGFKVVEAEYNSMQAEKDKIVDSLITLGSLGVNDVEYQSQVLNQQFAIAIMNGNRSAQAALQKKLDVLGKYGGIYMALKNSLEFKTEQLILLETKYKQAKVDAEENLPQKFIVSDAYKAERKSYPMRWLIILVSTVSALFMSIIVIMVMEKISDYNSHKKFQIGQS
jgi:capsular polysaccharide biosynthesis protein